MRTVMTVNEAMQALGPGASITYLAEEDDGLWWCEIALPLDRYTVNIVASDGPDPDTAMGETVQRALTVFPRNHAELCYNGGT